MLPKMVKEGNKRSNDQKYITNNKSRKCGLVSGFKFLSLPSFSPNYKRTNAKAQLTQRLHFFVFTLS